MNWICIKEQFMLYKLNQFLTHTIYMQIDSQRISLAPMLDVTTPFFRKLIHLLSSQTILYTEMIHQNAILHNKLGPQRFLSTQLGDHPVVLQLGGSNPAKLGECSQIAKKVGFDQVNLNVGCPSPRVKAGSFGACLMTEPKLVAECLYSMRASGIPATVKCRIGVDDHDSYQDFKRFVHIVSTQGHVQHFIVHARKAFLSGLSPAQNRTIPPLKYDYVYNIKKEFPGLRFTINGGFKTHEDIARALDGQNHLEGVMLGRLAYQNPWFFSDVDRRYFGYKNEGRSRLEVLREYAEYVDKVLEERPTQNAGMLRKPLINLFHGQKNCRVYRTALSCKNEEVWEYSSFKEYIESVIQQVGGVNEAALHERPPIE